ncbi:unnamed protein product [Musa hybrid cultivar]
MWMQQTKADHRGCPHPCLSFAIHRGAVTSKVFANGVRASRHGALVVVNSAVVLLGSTNIATEINLLRPTHVEANVGNPDSRLARRVVEASEERRERKPTRAKE